MTSLSFQNIITNHFDFLVSNYSYQIKFTEFNHVTGEDGVACIYSKKTLIYVEKSRFDYLITMVPAGEPEFTQMSILWILKALTIDVENLQYQTVDIDTFDGYVSFYAKLMRKYCMSFVNGDFSEWPKVLEYFINESKAQYHQRTGKQLPKRVHYELETYIAKRRSQTGKIC